MIAKDYDLIAQAKVATYKLGHMSFPLIDW